MIVSTNSQKENENYTLIRPWLLYSVNDTGQTHAGENKSLPVLLKKLEQEKQRLLRLIEEMKRRIRNKEKDLEAPETLDERVTRKIEGEPNVDQDERDRQEREARFDD